MRPFLPVVLLTISNVFMTMQEVITLLVFVGFSVTYLREPLRWNYVVGFVLIILAAFFVFRKW